MYAYLGWGLPGFTNRGSLHDGKQSDGDAGLEARNGGDDRTGVVEMECPHLKRAARNGFPFVCTPARILCGRRHQIDVGCLPARMNHNPRGGREEEKKGEESDMGKPLHQV